MKISILILTHNRPKLFKRCLNSILINLPSNIEILVNNDSNDIEYFNHNQIKYYKYQDKNLSNIYNFLFDKAKGEYIYFLEDDDYVNNNFWNIIQDKIVLNKDIYYMNFVPINKKQLQLGSCFQIEKENNMFQLSQILFKKELVKEFPTGNRLDNDWILFQEILKYSKEIEKINIPMFIQTCDGKDNISFKEFNNDKRFM